MKIIAALPVLLLAGTAIVLAEVGDIHTVGTNTAQVRETPDKNGKPVEKLSQGAEVMEMDVKGEWYEIYVASSDLSGWIHVSTLKLLGAGGDSVATDDSTATKPAAAKPAPRIKITTVGKSTDAIKAIRKVIIKRNANKVALKGYAPYISAEDIGDGKLQVTVTDSFTKRSKGEMLANLIVIHTSWKKSYDNAQVIAVDADGNEIYKYPR